MLSPGVPIASSSPRKKSQVKNAKIKPLRILNVNCQSISNKRKEFEQLLDNTKADVIFGTESWLRKDIKDHEVFPDGYTVYRKDRKNGIGGRVFIAVKDYLISSHMANYDADCEILWVKINTASWLYLASYYRPNAHDEERLKHLDESLQKIPRNNSHVWIAGDMNLPGIIWPSGSLKSDCPSPAQHELFMKILADHGLTQVIDKPTHEENILDLVPGNNPTLLNRTEIIPGISDPQHHKQNKRKIPIYKKAEWNKIEDEMNEAHQKIRDQSDSKDVDTLWEIFKSRLLSSISKYVPHRTASAHDRPPWITQKSKESLKARDHLFKKIQHKPSDSCKEKLKSLKKSIRKTTREAYWSYTENLITESGEDYSKNKNKTLWTFIKHRKTDSIDIAPLKENGVLKDTSREKAEILNAQFSSVFTTDDPSDFPDQTPWHKDLRHPKIADIQISEDGVEKLLTRPLPQLYKSSSKSPSTLAESFQIGNRPTSAQFLRKGRGIMLQITGLCLLRAYAASF